MLDYTSNVAVSVKPLSTINSIDDLKKLAELKEAGHISQEEYDVQKQKFLS